MSLLGDFVSNGKLPDVNTNVTVEIKEKTFFLMFAYGILLTAGVVFTIEILKGLFRLVKK